MITLKKKLKDCLWIIKIENNNKINAELESMVKTLYDYWFLQFESNKGAGKPYRTPVEKWCGMRTKKRNPEGWRGKNSGLCRCCLCHLFKKKLTQKMEKIYIN